MYADPDPDPAAQINADPCGSGFETLVLGPDSVKSVDPYPDPYSESGTFINEQKDQRTKCIQSGKVPLQSIPAVLRIRDVYPASRIRLFSRVADPHSGS